jgi:hypothetical protein
MVKVTIDEIQRDPLKYRQPVEACETLILVRSETLIAELRPIATAKQLRLFSLCAGRFTAPAAFGSIINSL